MRLARVTKTLDGKGLIELSDPAESAEFPSEMEATAFLLRAGWTPYGTSHPVSSTINPSQMFRQPALSVRPFVAVPGPEPNVMLERREMSSLPDPVELWSFPLWDGPGMARELCGFRFGLKQQQLWTVAEDPVLGLLVPYPLRIEAIGYWDRMADCLNGAVMLIEQLENLYGRELFHAALGQNIQRILLSLPPQ